MSSANDWIDWDNNKLTGAEEKAVDAELDKVLGSTPDKWNLRECAIERRRKIRLYLIRASINQIERYCTQHQPNQDEQYIKQIQHKLVVYIYEWLAASSDALAQKYCAAVAKAVSVKLKQNCDGYGIVPIDLAMFVEEKLMMYENRFKMQEMKLSPYPFDYPESDLTVFDDPHQPDSMKLINVKPEFRFLWDEHHIKNKAIVACRGGGKTVAVMQYLIWNILYNEAVVEAMYFASDFKTTTQVINRVLDYAITFWERYGICNVKKNMSNFRFTFDFKRNDELGIKARTVKFYFGSYEKGRKNRGPHPQFVIFDECGNLSHELYEQELASFNISDDGKNIYLGTPYGKGNILYDFIMMGEDEARLDWKSWRMPWSSYPNLLSSKHVEAKRNEISNAAFMQEIECSFESVEGTELIYAKILRELESKGRITEDVNYEHDRPLYISVDLGISDFFAAWFFQTAGDEIRFINYYEGNQLYLRDNIEELRKIIGGITGQADDAVTSRVTHTFVPHDAIARHGGLDNPLNTFVNFGMNPIRIERTDSVITDIFAVKQHMPSMSFNSKWCKKGIANLKEYKYKMDKYQVTGVPLHIPPYCDAADALRYAVMAKEYWKRTIKPVVMQQKNPYAW